MHLPLSVQSMWHGYRFCEGPSETPRREFCLNLSYLTVTAKCVHPSLPYLVCLPIHMLLSNATTITSIMSKFLLVTIYMKNSQLRQNPGKIKVCLAERENTLKSWPKYCHHPSSKIYSPYSLKLWLTPC